MDLTLLRAYLAEVPDVELPISDPVRRGIDDEAAYLASDAAVASLAQDTYWPKWRSPWWSMVLLDELGAADRIPARIVEAMVAGLQALPLHTFPIAASDWPPGANRARDSTCHCALGCMTRVLTACGVDVAAALPWAPPWFTRYQMADGGYNCDESAYLVPDECPSSMVGTISLLEAMTLGPPSDVCDRAAQMVLGRGLTAGSTTRHNADERIAAQAWGAPCFPRFYYYDTLRGLAAVVAWATAHRRALPATAIAPTVAALAAAAPDGVVRIGRSAVAGRTTWACGDDGAWSRQATSTFPLLDAVGQVGAPSPALTHQWHRTRQRLRGLVDAGLVTG
ncbi:MAG: hypothetical protein R3B06_31940 [Kofleriaceae bacterium]